MNRSYRIGYHFEKRVIAYLENLGYLVIRSGKSKFPDGIAIKDDDTMIFECKVNKYLSDEERKAGADIYRKTGRYLVVFYRNKRKIQSYVFDYKKWSEEKCQQDAPKASEEK